MIIDGSEDGDGHKDTGEIGVSAPKDDGVICLVAHIYLAKEHDDRCNDTRCVDEANLLFCRVNLRHEVSGCEVYDVAAIKWELYGPLYVEASRQLGDERNNRETDDKQLFEARAPILTRDKRKDRNAEVHPPKSWGRTNILAVVQRR